MLIFANQQYLFLLLLVPLMPLLYALVRWLRKRRLSRIGDPALVKQLIPSWSGAKGWVRLVLSSHHEGSQCGNRCRCDGLYRRRKQRH